MARSGDGNYYYVEHPRQLAAIFQAELRGLSATVGTDARLALEPAMGVAVADVLNDLDRDPDGRCQLPNLVSGFPVLVVLRLEVPPTSGDRRVVTVRLEWTATGSGARQSATAGLTLPGVPSAKWATLAPDLDVQERAVLLAIARIKKAATQALDRGNPAEARRLLAEGRALLSALPQTAEVGAEVLSLAELDAMLERGDYASSSKRAKLEAYSRRHSKVASASRPPTRRRREKRRGTTDRAQSI
jgi:Ca-activated chloride channel family protein